MSHTSFSLSFYSNHLSISLSSMYQIVSLCSVSNSLSLSLSISLLEHVVLLSVSHYFRLIFLLFLSLSLLSFLSSFLSTIFDPIPHYLYLSRSLSALWNFSFIFIIILLSWCSTSVSFYSHFLSNLFSLASD